MRFEEIPEPTSDYERHLIDLIDFHRRQYEQAIEPYIKRLAQFRSLRTPRYTVSLEPGDEIPAALHDSGL